MDTVVVSLDGSEESRAAVRWCSRHLGPATRVIAVCGIGDFGEAVMSVPPFDADASEARIKECVENEWVGPIRRAGLQCEPRLVRRRQMPALAEVVAVERPDAVVMGRPPHHRFGALNRVLRQVHCPILLVPSEANPRTARDGSATARNAAGQAPTGSVLPFARTPIPGSPRPRPY